VRNKNLEQVVIVYMKTLSQEWSEETEENHESSVTITGYQACSQGIASGSSVPTTNLDAPTRNSQNIKKHADQPTKNTQQHRIHPHVASV
jgi:hypothetical protein